jgi:putative effector of murein hydrolase LrgA (UPF0299 family)
MSSKRAASTIYWFRKPTAIIVISLALIYLATLTSNYYWDGITFALQIEKVAKGERGASLLFHQNHLLYNPAGYLIYAPAHAIGMSIRALSVLQIINAIAGAIAVGVFFRMAERATGNRYAAIISSSALAVSSVWWKLATDADAYILSLLFMLLCASNLFSEKPRWHTAGLALAGAMLLHELAALFYPAAIVTIFSNRNIERRWKFAAGMSSIAWTATVGVYYVCAVLLRGIEGPIDVVKWAVSNQSGVSPSLNPLHGLWLLPRANLDLIVGHNFGFVLSNGGWVESGFALAALITAAVFVFKVLRRVKPVGIVKSFIQPAFYMSESMKRFAPALVTWIGAYLLFLIFWEPWQTYYRVFYAPALLLVFGIALSNYHRLTGNAPSGAAAFAAAALALFNLAFFIIPNMRTDSNARVAAARDAGRVWNERTVIYFADHTEVDTTFEYFNSETRWRRLTSDLRSNLASEVERASSQGRSVWLNKGAIESLDSDWLSKYARGREIKLEAANASARYLELLPVQSHSLNTEAFSGSLLSTTIFARSFGRDSAK